MTSKTHLEYKRAIEESGKDIYEVNEVGDPRYWIPSPELEALLNDGLSGLSLEGLPLRTRSKVVKQEVCKALGYPVPKSFKKTQPRFLGQQLDIYTQKSRNLQIWNEELSPNRRYAIISISEADVVDRVKVVNGQELALLDNTGTITTKYQARIDVGDLACELVSPKDTAALTPIVNENIELDPNLDPTEAPDSSSLMSIARLYELLSPMIGTRFPDPGVDQERNRGAAIHKIVCNHLGYQSYGDLGVFPDIRNQLLEIKLQTSPTIDLGLVLPSSGERLDIPEIEGIHPLHRDARYAIFYASTDNSTVEITHLVLCSGEDFFRRFTQFGGREINGKIQIPLPADFFSG